MRRTQKRREYHVTSQTVTEHEIQRMGIDETITSHHITTQKETKDEMT